MTLRPNSRLSLNFTLNDSDLSVEIEARSSLLDVLRQQLRLTGTKKGCNQGACGACTVLVDGARVLACLTLAAQVDGRSVTTIEGIGTPDSLHPLQQAFITTDGFQCGYCTSGQICSAVGMLTEYASGTPSAVSEHLAASSTLSPAEIRERMSGNICRCGAYNGIIEAITSTAGASQ